TVLADDPMLNCRIEGSHQPVRVIADSKLRIPLDSNIIKTAGEYRTIIACAVCDERKKAEIEKAGAEVICIPVEKAAGPDEDAKTDLYRLMRFLGEQKLDSCLVEGGGILHEAMLESGLVNHVCAYIAPKVIGGKDARTPVEGQGAERPEFGALLENGKITQIGEDILLEYDVKEGMNGVYRNR
ncbi:MAG: RibD family protein, partial [Lachnospiraceae bacterium]|nr:RibD family protein [Lachnospiraceae bacterium]